MFLSYVYAVYTGCPVTSGVYFSRRLGQEVEAEEGSSS